MIGVVCDKNYPTKRLRLELRVGEKQNRTAGFAQKSASDVPEKRMKRGLFFQCTGDDKIDVVLRDSSQNSIGRIALTIMNRRIARQLQPAEDFLKFFCRLVSSFADVDQ